MNHSLITLRANRWYGWHMFPGYVGPYASLIRIDDVRARKTGWKLLDIDFFNAGYARGVRNFRLCLRVLTRTPTFLVGDIVDNDDHPSDRVGIIMELTRDWIRTMLPNASAVLPLPDSSLPEVLQCYAAEVVALSD